ncbi:ABC transporter permease [Propioniciclava sinopodophylli]|uniref:ABC transporter permease n=1 Tax=Propioniciclava sinopodophylli TaxID=1837344 RepID=UPI00249376D6|nr:ABC transporter permease [Propioniciclava sinopodophylli]
MVLLVALGVAASLAGRMGLARQQVVAAVRAVLQLAVVSLVLAAAVQTLWGAFAFWTLMFGVALWTTTGRVSVRDCWPWTAVSLLAGLVPVLLIVFGTGASPFNGITLIALGGIVTGNMMTAHTLAGRRVFGELRESQGEYEAALALGLLRRDAIGLVIDRVVPEALIPNLDQTRTVGLVTLPGAFIGVLLGGGSPLQAGAAQVLVLVAIMAGQACTVAAMAEFVRRGLIVPADLRPKLHV